MSAILSADDLNDFISPGVACIKPIETIPQQNGENPHNPYEVTTEDKVAAANPAPAQISLTDCLACSGCVTSAEAVLVSLQSHTEVLNTLDAFPSLTPQRIEKMKTNGYHYGTADNINDTNIVSQPGKIFVASVSPQTRGSLAATYGISHAEAGNMIAQLLSGPHGVAAGGVYGSSFLWIIDTNQLRQAALVLAADEVASALSDPSSASADDGNIDTKPKKPILTSACPGWICYAEKTHPYILPHLSRLKSPQALTGTLLKSILSKRYRIPPSHVWHLAIMPCFDKKLEASRSELTSTVWADSEEGIRDVDCVITARELIALAAARGIDFASLSRKPLARTQKMQFPDPVIDRFLFPPARRKAGGSANGDASGGTSGGYLWHILQTYRAQNPGSRIQISRGRNADVVEYLLVRDSAQGPQEILFKAARYYGFRNIQNLVRRLKPARTSKLLAARGGAVRRPGGVVQPAAAQNQDYAYVEVMACPGGCTNGGGQIKAGEVGQIRGEVAAEGSAAKVGPQEQREWLARVDEAYFSASSSSSGSEEEDDDQVEDFHMANGHVLSDHGQDSDSEAMEVDGQLSQQGSIDEVDGISHRYIHDLIEHWSCLTGVEKQKLVLTSYRKVESDVGKKANDVERVAGLASSIGGGW